MNKWLPELSVVVPMYRESANASRAIAEIRARLVDLGADHELIIVDDGSPDDTWERIRVEAIRGDDVRAVRLSRNFGKEHALVAGLELACGRAVVVMDGDLQHPPALLASMLRIWRNGEADIVEAVKVSRGRESLAYSFFAGAFYRILHLLSGFDLTGASDFKLLDRKVVNVWMQLRERHLFFRGMTAWLGFRRVTVPFDVAPRVGGRSQWAMMSLVRLALTAVTSFSSVLLQIVTFVGVMFLGFSTLMGVHTLAVWASGKAITGFTTVILLLLIVGSVLMISLGIIGLYLARIYDEVKGRPRYIVCETIGFSASRLLLNQPRSITAEAMAYSATVPSDSVAPMA